MPKQKKHGGKPIVQVLARINRHTDPKEVRAALDVFTRIEKAAIDKGGYVIEVGSTRRESVTKNRRTLHATSYIKFVAIRP